MQSSESGLLDVSTSEMQEKLDISQIKVEMPQNISHSEMPDITKRIYDMEQPLDLGPLKKKVFLFKFLAKNYYLIISRVFLFMNLHEISQNL